jgi:hypothetical protein
MEIRQVKCGVTGEQLVITKPGNLQKLDDGKHLSVMDIIRENEFISLGQQLRIDIK